MLLVLIGVAVGFGLEIHPFLAITQPVPGQFLAVEGWLPDYALEATVKEFNAHAYEKLFVIGCALDRGSHLSAYGTYARLGAATLEKLGMSTNTVVAVPALPGSRDRTYFSSLALGEWFQRHGRTAKAINIVSLGPHARRTRLLFSRALGPAVAVGVIAIEDRDYDPKRWWKTSAGVRSLVDETVAYLYARFLFYRAR